MRAGSSQSVHPAFGEFLDHLRRNGFAIGIDYHLRLQRLLNKFDAHTAPSDLKTLLAPIFAVSQKQQESFYRAFDDYFEIFQPANDKKPDRSSGRFVPPADRMSALHPITEALQSLKAALKSFDWFYLQFGAWLLALIAGLYTVIKLFPGATSPGGMLPFIGVIFLLFAIILLGQIWGRSPFSRSRSSGQSRISPIYKIIDRVSLFIAALLLLSPIYFLTDWFAGASGSGIELAFYAAAGLICIISLIWLYKFLRRPAIQKQEGEKPPYSLRLQVNEVPPKPFDTQQFYAAAGLLRQWQEVESRCFDIEKTIAATIQSAGYPTLIDRPETAPPAYLVLIDRVSYRDHQASYFEILTAALENAEVLVDRFYYDGDPRICYGKNSNDSIRLADLRSKYEGNRLIMIGDGERLIDPITGRLENWAEEFASWKDLALLTPEPPQNWGWREMTLMRLFIPLPATLNGLDALMDHFNLRLPPNLRRWRGNNSESISLEAGRFKNLDTLRATLDGGTFQWLCACAVHAELQWNLTLYLAALPGMPENLVNETNLLRLIRLPWFRAGAIPDEWRARLIAELGQENEKVVRAAIIELLESNPAPAGSFAEVERQFELYVQRLWLFHLDPGRRRQMLQTKTAPQADRSTESYALLRMARSLSFSPLMLNLPHRRLMQLFRYNFPLFGRMHYWLLNFADAAVIASHSFSRRAETRQGFDHPKFAEPAAAIETTLPLPAPSSVDPGAEMDSTVADKKRVPVRPKTATPSEAAGTTRVLVRPKTLIVPAVEKILYAVAKAIDPFEELYRRDLGFQVNAIRNHIARHNTPELALERGKFVRQLRQDMPFARDFVANLKRMISMDLKREIKLKDLAAGDDESNRDADKYTDYPWIGLSNFYERVETERKKLNEQSQNYTESKYWQESASLNEKYGKELADLIASLQKNAIARRPESLERILGQVEAMMSRIKKEKTTFTITEELTSIDQSKGKLQGLVEQFKQARFRDDLFYEIGALKEKRKQAKLCIKAYEQYMAERIRGIDIIHVKSYIYKISRRFGNRENAGSGWFSRFKKFLSRRLRRYPEEWKSELIEKDYKEYPHLKSFVNQHRLGFLKAWFYVFLFAVDGAYWGRLILSPIFEKTAFLENLSNVTLVDYLISPSSNWADLWAVIIFHALSFGVVLLLSRLPTRLAFYYKMLNFVIKDEGRALFEGKEQGFVFRDIAKIIKTLAEKLAAQKPFFYYFSISYYYVMLALVPLFFKVGDFRVMIPVNLLFWVILHFSYRWFGEVSFILRGELRWNIEKFEFAIPADIKSLEEQLNNEFAQESARRGEALIGHLRKLRQRFEAEMEETSKRLLPLTKLQSQEKQKQQELEKIKSLMQKLENAIMVYDNKRIEIGSKITVASIETICAINCDEVENAIR